MSLNPKYLQPGTEIAFYRVVDQLGTGGLGAVYKAERDGRPYALKISTYSLLELGPEERGQLDARAKREFGALAQLLPALFERSPRRSLHHQVDLYLRLRSRRTDDKT